MSRAPDEFLILRTAPGGELRVTAREWNALELALANRRPLDARQAQLLRAIMATLDERAAWQHPSRRGHRPDPPQRAPSIAILFAGGPLAGGVIGLDAPPALLCGLHVPGIGQNLNLQPKLARRRSCLPYARDPAAPADAPRVLYRFAPNRAPEAADDCRRRASG